MPAASPRRSGNHFTIRPTTPMYTIPVPSPANSPYVRYSAARLCARAPMIQLPPTRIAPVASSLRTPKRSTR